MNALFGWATVAALVATASLQAQSLTNSSVEGLLFIQKGAFNNPEAAARPVEFQSASGNDKITIVVTREGRRLRLHSADIGLIIPYPGRGGFQKKEALALCDLAIQRYPQHETLLSNVRNAWNKVTRADYLAYQQQSAARQGMMDGAMETMAADAQRAQENSLFKPRERTPNLLDQPKATPAPRITSKDLEKRDPATDQPELTDSLETIRRFYQQLNQTPAE